MYGPLLVFDCPTFIQKRYDACKASSHLRMLAMPTPWRWMLAAAFLVKPSFAPAWFMCCSCVLRNMWYDKHACNDVYVYKFKHKCAAHTCNNQKKLRRALSS